MTLIRYELYDEQGNCFYKQQRPVDLDKAVLAMLEKGLFKKAKKNKFFGDMALYMEEALEQLGMAFKEREKENGETKQP